MDVAPGVGERVDLIAAEAIMDAGATKLGSNGNGIERLASATVMSRVVSESIGRADVDPPPRCADAQSCFILVDHARLHQSSFQVGFHLSQLLVAGGDKVAVVPAESLNPSNPFTRLLGPG